MWGGPAGDTEFQRSPGVGQGMEAVAGQGEEVHRAGRSSSDSAGRSHPAPVVHRLKSRREHRTISQVQQ